MKPEQPSQSAVSRETLVGSVERVTFHNDENGFAVLKVKVRGKRDLVPVIGHAASISAGEYIHAVGVWINDRAHGLQFKADFLKTMPPTTAEGIEKYLGSGMVRGIGPKLRRKHSKRLTTKTPLAPRRKNRMMTTTTASDGYRGVATRDPRDSDLVPRSRRPAMHNRDWRENVRELARLNSNRVA